jgi:hypothetical protein
MARIESKIQMVVTQVLLRQFPDEARQHAESLLR